jgi:vacuolar-type H+-ATPase subunit H
MFRNWAFALGLIAATGLTLGCDSASKPSGSATQDAKKTIAEAAKDAKKTVQEAGEDAKKTVQDAGKDAKKTVEEAGKDAKKSVQDAGKEAADKAKELVLKPINDALPKIEEKLKGLKGEALTNGDAKLAALKKMIDEYKASDGTGDLKEKLVKAFEELKKLAGV